MTGDERASSRPSGSRTARRRSRAWSRVAPRHSRQGTGDRRDRRRPARSRTRAARGLAGTRQDRAGQGAVAPPVARLPPHPVHARPAADRHHRQPRAPGARRPQGVRVSSRPGLHQRPARRRDQPRVAEDAGGAPRSDAGARVTTFGDTRRASHSFFVLATQNPIELEGTYPLPEAQLDRFMFKVDIAGVERSVLEEILLTRVHGDRRRSRPSSTRAN